MAKGRKSIIIPEVIMLDPRFRKLRPNARLLFFYMIVRRASQGTPFTYPYKEIRQDSRMKYKTIANGIRELAKAGILEYTHGGLEQGGNTYTISTDWI